MTLLALLVGTALASDVARSPAPSPVARAAEAPDASDSSAPHEAVHASGFEPGEALDKLATGLKKRYPHPRAQERIETTIGRVKESLPEVPPENPVQPRHVGLVGIFLDGRIGAKVLEYRMKEAGLSEEQKAALEAKRQQSLRRSERALDELENEELPFGPALMAPVRDEPAGVAPPEAYARVARKRRRDPRAQANLGTALAAAGRPAEAVKAFDAALALGPDAAALSGRAAAWHALGDFVRAREDAAAALLLDASDGAAAATLKLSEGRVGGGEAGGAGAARLALEASADRGSPAAPASGTDAAAAPPRAVPEELREAERQAEKALSALKLDDRETALDGAEHAERLAPLNPVSSLVRAHVALREGRAADAYVEAARGLTDAPRHAPLLQAAARAANRARKPREAFAAASRWLEASPDEPAALAELAHAQGLLGDRDAMVGLLERAAAADPRYAVSLESALVMPPDADMLFLFPGEAAPQAVLEALRGRGAPKRRRWPWEMAAAAAAALAGGLVLLRAAAWLARRSPGAPVMRRDDRKEGTPGVLAGKYEVLGVLAEGGMGLVYEGRDLSLSRRVAIKRLREELKVNPRERRRFVEEARIVARLRHPNVVDIYSVVEEHDEVYLVFEFVEGETVHELVSRRGVLDWREALAVFRGIAAAVDFAHQRGVVHRDLKPTNVVLVPDGTVKVMDFGIARLAQEAARSVMTNEVVGTPAYMAPEQEKGEVRPESDVFALGVCLYEMVCGCRPFAGDEKELLESKLKARFLLPSEAAPGLPEGLDAVIAKALHPDPAQRFPSAGRMAEALASLGRASVSRA